MNGTDLPMQTGITLIEATTDIVSAYVGRSPCAASDIPKLITEVHAALKAVEAGGVGRPPDAAPLVPAVSIRKSVAPDFIICLEDGKRFKSLKRHLRSSFDLSPDQYRAKWGLPADYPMVAPNYAVTRSRLAKDNGLGRRGLQH